MLLRRGVFFICASAVLSLALAACGGGGGSGGSVTPVATATPGSAPVVPAFSTIAAAPNALTGSSQVLSLPTVPGVSSVGGSINVQSTGAGNASVMLAAAGGSSGPPTPAVARRSSVALTSSASSPITPVYYIGITNTSNAPTQVSFTTMTLTVPPLSAGWSYALACLDPSNPAGWNEDCAFGPSEVSVSGTSATFTLNRTFTIYPGVTLWFAPYAYPATNTAPTPEPSQAPVVPTPPPGPPSLTGTYVGSANGQSDPQYLEVSLTQSGSNVTGTYALVPDGKDNGSFGTLSGTVSNGTLTLAVTEQYGGGSCGTGTINATVSGILINGTYTPATTPTCGNGGSGSFSIALQSGITQTVSGNFTGTISDSSNGAGTLAISITQPGTVFSGNANVTWQSSGQTGTGAMVGFMVNSTTAEFAVITNGSCGPIGTLTISGKTLNGTYNEIGGPNSNCSGTGTFAVSQ